MFLDKSTEANFMLMHREKQSTLYHELFGEHGLNWEEEQFLRNVTEAVIGRVMRLAYNEREAFFYNWLKERVRETTEISLKHDEARALFNHVKSAG